MENKYYVYVYMDPTKRGSYFYEGLDFSFLYEPFYIGKGCNSRFKNHLMPSSLDKDSFFYKKLRSLISKKINPIIEKIYLNLYEKDAYEREIFLISKIGKKTINTGPLFNISDGGDGITLKGEEHPNWGKNLKESTRKKISERLKLNNPMRNPEVVERVRLKNLGREPWNKGKSEKRPEVIKKLSEKKIKYRNIKAISKENGEIIEFENTYEVVDFMNKTYRMIMIYFERGESKDYFWKFDKID
jgi:hypothetical protein